MHRGNQTEATDYQSLSEYAILQLRICEMALANTHDFNYVFDLQGRFIYVNRRLLDLWGKRAGEAVGKNFFELDYPPELAAKLQRQIQEVIETKQSLRDDTPYTSAIGTRAYEYIFAPVFDAEGHVEAVAGSTRDITDRKQAEEQLRDAQARLAAHAAELSDADRRKDEFLAMLAHELRNPLASVRNAVTLLKESDDPESHAWATSVVDRQTAQLARLVEDLLDVSRITRGRIELRRELIDAASILESAADAADPFIAQRDHTLTTDIPRGILWTEADPARLEQIVLNLLANAAKYTPPHGRISLRAALEKNAADGKAEIVISVQDDGIGIPPERIPMMFELFAQGERSAARTEGGLGIGLTVVRALCELHGGSVTAESAGKGKGTTFTVRLPAAPAPASQPARAEPVTASDEGGGRCVLIVDDNIDTASGLGRLLSRRGYEVHLAHNGRETLELARRLRPHVILLDIGLPAMDGYEVASRLRSDAAHAKTLLIAISGYGQNEDRARSQEAGFDHHLVKPANFETLRQILMSPAEQSGGATN